MKRYLALFLLLALLLPGCAPEAPSSAAPTTSATEPSSSAPEKATDPSSPPTEEPKNATDTEVSDDGTIMVTTTDPAGKVLSRIIYDPYSDTTEKRIREYSEMICSP